MNRDHIGRAEEPVHEDGANQTGPDREGGRHPDLRVTRRALVRRSGMLVATTAVGTAVATSDPSPAGIHAAQEATEVPTAEQYPRVPYPPATPPAAGELAALSEGEAAVVEALTARILPGTPEDPGAREAGVVTYIDNLLAAEGGFAEATYRAGPWAETFEGDAPPASGPDDVVWVKVDQAERYGYQSRLTPLETYQQGVAAVERFAQERFGTTVGALSEADQDQIIQALLDDEATGFEEVPFTPSAFFHVLRRHTSEGMFSDPAYGGNRDLAGWRLIGYPGAQRAYLPLDIITEGTDLQPQSLAELTHFHAGRPEETDERAPILPVSGSDDDA